MKRLRMIGLRTTVMLAGVLLLGLSGGFQVRAVNFSALDSATAEVAPARVSDPHGDLIAVHENHPSYIPFAERDREAQPLSTFIVTYAGFTPAAQTAFQRAVGIWSSIVSSPVPIKVKTRFRDDLGGALGQGGGTFIWRDFRNAPLANTWYFDAVADRLAGFDISTTLYPSGQPELNPEFNSNINWYYGLDGHPGPGQYDFVSVVLHELGHGLGFGGSAFMNTNGTGGWGHMGDPFIFDRYIKNGLGQPITSFPTPSTALAAQLTSNNLFFVSPVVRAANPISAPAKIFAPATWQPGSSYTHLDPAAYPRGTPNSLMGPYLAAMEAIHDPGSVVREIFADVGWGPISGGPPPPTNLMATVVGNQVTVTWNAAAGATSYRVVATGPGLAVDLNVGLLTTVAGTLPNGTYTVQVYAVNAAGQSAATTTTFTVGGVVPPPPAPPFVTPVVSGRNVMVTWPPVLGATSYQLRATLNGVLVFNSNVGNSNAVGANDVPPGAYTITVFSVGPGGQSPTGASASFVVP